MLDKQEFNHIRKDLLKFEQQREQVIQISRDIIKESKQIIYAVHRNDLKEARSLVTSILTKKNKLPKELYDANIQKVALQEYVEALCYYEFVRTGKIPTRDDLKVDTEDYLMGLCDLTGELTRRMVFKTIEKNFDEVIKIKDLVEEIYGEFLKFDLRNGELRKKSDSIKWNLKKIEDVLYDINMKNMIK